VSAAEQVNEHQLNANGVTLNVLEVAPEQGHAPCVVMLHGLRDSAWSLLPVATAICQPGAHHPGYRVLLPELRGHGRSSRSEAYAMPNFLLDLHGVVSSYTDGACALFGHSLGGHIVTKYAALFPEIVKAMLVVEGLGPPARPHEGNPGAEMRVYRDMLLTRLAERSSSSRPLADAADASARLQRNNPRLTEEQANRIAPHLVEAVEDGLRWAFDSRANSVFLGVSTADNIRFWQQVQAPTCFVSGALSHEYWGREMSTPGFTGRFAEGEMETRVEHFQNHEHHWFDRSGHMVHYDEPERLGALCRQFLEQHYV